MEAAPAASIANSCSKNRSPWKRDGGIDDIFGYNGPTQMITRILHKPEITADATLAAFDAVIREVQENGISEDELQPSK